MRRHSWKNILFTARNGDKNAIRLLADATMSEDRVVRRMALEFFSSMTERDAIESCCDYLMSSDNQALRKICIINGYCPDDEGKRALFYVITRQAGPYYLLDFRDDRPILARAFTGASPAVRKRVLEAARDLGMGMIMAEILSMNPRDTRDAHTTGEWRTLLGSLQENCEWERLWSLAFEVPVEISVEIIGILKDAGWKGGKTDAKLWNDLVRLLPDEWHFPEPPDDRGQVLHRPEQTLQRLALHPEGRLLAAAGYDGTLTVFSLPEGKIIHSIATGCRHINGLVFSPDGNLLAAAGSNPGILILDPWKGRICPHRGEETSKVLNIAFTRDSSCVIGIEENGSIIRHDTRKDMPETLFSGQGKKVTAMTKSPVDDTLIWGEVDGSIHFLTLNNSIVSVSGHREPVTFLTVTGDGSHLVSAVNSGYIRFWNTLSKEKAGRTGEAGVRIMAVAVAPGAPFCAYAAEDGTLRVVGVPEGKEQACFHVSRKDITCLAFTSDASFLVGGGKSGDIYIWDLDGKCLKRSLKGYREEVRTLCIAPSGSAMITGSWDGSIALRSLPDGDLMQVLTPDSDTLTSMAVSPVGARIISGTGRGRIKVREYPGGAHINTFGAYTPGISCMAADRMGELLICAGVDGTLNIWGLGKGNLIKNISGHTGNVYSLAICPDDSLFAAGGWDHTIRLCSFPGAEIISELHGHRSLVSCLVFSGNGKFLYSGSNDRTVRIWDSHGGPLAVLEGHRHVVSCLAPASDDTVLCSGSWDKSVRLWDLPGGEPLGELGPHPSRVSALAVSPDSTLLASGCEDGSLCLWSFPGRDMIRTRIGHTCKISGLAFSPDGNRIIAGYANGTIRSWSLPWTKSLSCAVPCDLEFVSRQASAMSCSPNNSSRQWKFLECLLQGKFRWAISSGDTEDRAGAFDIEIVE